MRHETLTPDAQALFEAFAADTRAQGLAPDSSRVYVGIVRQFLSFLGPKNIASVGIDDLRAYLTTLQKRPLSAKSITHQFITLGNFFAYLHAENQIQSNPVPTFRQRYLKALRREASKIETVRRQLISVEDMRRLVHSLPDTRDRAVLTLLAKTGIRGGELVTLDVTDVNWKTNSITLKKTRKRSNRLVYFDDETARVLKRWLNLRKARGATDTGPLFTGSQGRRLRRHEYHSIIVKPAEALGLHDADGSLEQRFTAHNTRHWFTTHMRRAGMTREHVSWLRGDAPQGTIDIYMHIDPAEVRESYLARVPKLDI